MRVKYFVIGLLALLLIIMPISVVGGGETHAPTVTPKDAETDPGEEFELKVSVVAKINSTYRVTFNEKDRFSFPELNYQEHNITKGDGILFKILCKVDDDAPDGDFNLTFKVTWEYNETTYSDNGAVSVTVGEGATVEDGPCESSIFIGVVAVLASSVLLIRRRKR